jgi:hypothetical protein
MARTHSKFTPSGANPNMKSAFECFVPDTRNRKVYILKDSGLKVLRAANTVMAMRTFGKYREIFLEKDDFEDVQRAYRDNIQTRH